MVVLFSVAWAVVVFAYGGALLQPRELGSLVIALLVIALTFINAFLPFWNRTLAANFGIYSSAASALVFTVLVVRLSDGLTDRHFWGSELLILGFSALLLLPSLFWRFVANRGWEPVSQKAKASAGVAALLILVFGAATSLVLAVHRREIGDCEFIHRPYAAQARPRQVLVRARITHRDPIFGSVAVVAQHYWGMPWWNRRIVFLKDVAGWNGKEVLLDGWRFDGIVSRFLPVIYFTCGTRTRLIENAEADLRILQDGPLLGIRIIGRTATEHSYADYLLIPKQGVEVEAFSDKRKFVARTDEKGIYDFKNLPLDTYKVKLSFGEKICDPFPNYESVPRQSGDIGECNFTFPPESSPRKGER
jgi:hypothetical protein